MRSAINRDQGNKNLQHVIDPTTNAKPLVEVRQVYTSEKIKTDVHNAIAHEKELKELNATRRGGKIKRISDIEHRLVTRYLGGAVIQINHYQRPGVSSLMTLEEVLTAKDVGDGILMIGVKEHKTSTTHPDWRYARGRSCSNIRVLSYAGWAEYQQLQLAYGIILKRRGAQQASLRAMFAKPPARSTSRAIQSV